MPVLRKATPSEVKKAEQVQKESKAMENLLVRTALEKGLKVKLPDGTILYPPKNPKAKKPKE